MMKYRDGYRDGYNNGYIDALDAAARDVDCACAKRAEVLAADNKAARWRACPRDPCGALEAAYIRALPVPHDPR